MPTRKKKSKNPGWKGHGEISGKFFSEIKRRAKRRGIEFKLSLSFLWKLYKKQSGRCALSGLKIEFPENSSKLTDGTASLDRIDSSKGYTKGNVQWLEKRVNMIKYKYNQKEFLEICRQIVGNNKEE